MNIGVYHQFLKFAYVLWYKTKQEIWLIVDQPYHIPDSKVHGANVGPIWGRQDPGGPMLAAWTLLPGMVLLVFVTDFCQHFFSGELISKTTSENDGHFAYFARGQWFYMTETLLSAKLQSVINGTIW